VTFHDLRGTGITYACAMGADTEETAESSGTQTDCESINRRYYLAGSSVIEATRAGTKHK